MPRRLPLGPRLALAFAAPATAAVLACGAVAYVGTRDALEEELGRRLCALAQVAASTIPADLAATLQEGDEDTRTAQNIRRRLESVRVGGSAARVMLVDADRRVRLDSDGRLPIGASAPRLQFDQVEMERALTGTPSASVLFEGPDGALYKSCYAAVPAAEIPMVVAVEGAADLFRTLRALAGLYAVLVAVALILLVATAYTVARSLARPLFRLSQQARTMGEGELGRPIDVAADDEVGQVARALDEMRLRLLARDQERQMMLAGIAHEVRNPLGGMELYAGILSETAAELPPDVPAPLRHEIKNAVDRIRKELGHLSGVVNDFLMFARDVPPQRKELNVRQLLGEVSQLCAADGRNRQVEVAVEPEVPESLHAALDEGQIRRALLNLAQNAVQASPTGTRVRLSAALEGQFLTLAVQDQGPGMSREALQNALTPFFTTKEKGTGLGLPLVVKIARSHGGRLELTTEPGQGCRAELVLPRVDAPSVAQVEDSGWRG
ncbi:MAG: HAMP domain-containing sensor histidine kinase [Myxococcota bacterium]